jgi:hypothetical protein
MEEIFPRVRTEETYSHQNMEASENMEDYFIKVCGRTRRPRCMYACVPLNASAYSSLLANKPILEVPHVRLYVMLFMSSTLQ